MPSTLTPCQKAERSLRKKYTKTIWNPFIGALKSYDLIQPDDRIAVCISGGKDSMLLAKLMQQLQAHSDFPFSLVFLAMDPGYNFANRQKLLSNAALLEIPLSIFETNIFHVAAKAGKSPCYLCARMRRGHLYKQAQLAGCNKIALGHHFSDVVETILMGLLYTAQFQTMMPKLKSRNFPGMELIRPLYRVHEDAIRSWQNYNGFTFLQCACPLTENSGDGEDVGKRQEVKALIQQLKRQSPDVEKSIFQSVHCVNLETILGYKKDGQVHPFLKWYNNVTTEIENGN